MDSESNYLQGIKSAWLGELFGQAFFMAMADHAKEPGMQQAWHKLGMLEEKTAARMAALLEAHGDKAETNEIIEITDELIGQYTSVSHLESMSRLRVRLENAISRFDHLLAVAPESDISDVQFLVDHEQALLSFVDRELGGDHDNALAEVEKLLD